MTRTLRLEEDNKWSYSLETWALFLHYLVPIEVPISIQFVFCVHHFSLLLAIITVKCCGERRDGWDQMCRSWGWDLIEFGTEWGCGKEVDETLGPARSCWGDGSKEGLILDIALGLGRTTILWPHWHLWNLGICANRSSYVAEGELQIQFKITSKTRKLFTVTANEHFFCLELEDWQERGKSKRLVDHCWKIYLERSTKQVMQTQAMKAALTESQQESGASILYPRKAGSGQWQGWA